MEDLLANTRSPTEVEAMIVEMRRRGKSALHKVFETCDIVVALADSPLVMYSSAAGESRAYFEPAVRIAFKGGAGRSAGHA